MEILPVFKKYLGWCPNAPAVCTAPAIHAISTGITYPAEPGAGGATRRTGRVRHGARIAAGSLKAILQDRRLFWFAAIAGLMLLFLIAVEEWSVRNIMTSTPLLFSPGIGDSFLVIDTRLFLIELVCLSCFTILLSGLVLYRSGKTAGRPLTFRGSFGSIGTCSGRLCVLSVVTALFGTVLFEIISQSVFLGQFIMTLSMAVFYLPYAYYLPDPLSAAIYVSAKIIVVNIFLLITALYVIPGIVLGKKRMVPAIAGSVGLVRKTWREMLGCGLVFGTIFLGVAAIALVIGQSPLLLNHDFDFFINMSRGQPLMMTVCFLFLAACWFLTAAGFAVAGIAITDLYSLGTKADNDNGWQ